MIRNTTYSPRRAFTLVEVTVALALLAIVGAIVAQAIVWSLRERQQLAMQQAATEIASNVLEEARALPIEQLNQTWAGAQTLPSEVAGALSEGKLLVTIEPVKDAAQAKRVTAEVRWQSAASSAPHSIKLATVLTGRTTKQGSKP